MKMNIAIGSNRIEIDLNENEIVWTQRTSSSVSVTWPADVAKHLECIFAAYTLETFSFAKSSVGGYDVRVVLRKM